MQIIRNKFILKAKEITTDAIGAYVVFQLGINSHAEFASLNPHAPLSVYSGLAGTVNGRTCKYAPTHTQVQVKILANREVIFELFLSVLIQEWFDFLGNLYERIVDDTLTNTGKYKLNLKKIDLDLTQINTSVNQEIKVSAMKNFDFYDGKDKLEIIDKLLGSKVSHLTLEKNLLKENIIVRNVLQHRAGIVSQEDLQRLGVKAILEDHGNTNKLIATNQKVTRTAFDMEKITDAMINLALTLVP